MKDKDFKPVTLKKTTGDFLEELKNLVKETTKLEIENDKLELFCFIGEGFDAIPLNTAKAVSQLSPQSIVEYRIKGN